jgi:GntR family transcriptional regulator/MocR family aminotransferase
MRFREELSFALDLCKSSTEPLYQQLARQIEDAVTSGILPAGARVPATRTLSQILNVSRTVTNAAYLDLFGKGILVSHSGSGTYVAGNQTPTPPRPHKAAAPSDVELSAHTYAAQGGFPVDAWRAAWRQASHSGPDTAPPPAAGLPELREAIARYLRWSRGLPCCPANIFVTTGEAQSLELLTHALAAHRSVALEDPCEPALRQIFESRHTAVSHVGVDEHGLDPRALPPQTGLVLVAPAHQFPTGACLTLERRTELLDRARAREVFVVEDDPDTEYLYAGAPQPSLSHMSGMQGVAQIGDFSTLFGPELGVAYIAAATDVVQCLTETASTSQLPSTVAQRATAALLNGGHVQRRLSRMRQIIRDKRTLLTTLFAPLEPFGRLTGMHAGAHALIRLDQAVPALHVQAKLAQAGFRIHTLDDFSEQPQHENALVLGYGGLSETALARAMTALARAIRSEPQNTRRMTQIPEHAPGIPLPSMRSPRERTTTV